jgi:hypothetical protein|tara:strand:+ start:1852 stop:2499 length:648 start_codon:yes stop_codon:yes gene_type:complete
MKLITEEIRNVKYIVEQSKDGKKNYSIKGIFMQSDVKNKNGRIYPQHILQREVVRYNKDFINKNRAFGELGHPEGPTVNLERVSHMIKSLYPDGNNFIGEAKILDTPYGKIVKSLIDEGASLGVSSRGMGTLQNTGNANLVKDDYYLATAADIVADPSAPDAFVEGIMEGKEWVWDNGKLKEQDIDELKLQVERAQREQRAEINARVFESFLTKL